MRWLLITMTVLAGCNGPTAEPVREERSSVLRIVGNIESKKLNEASGMARSLRDPELFWSHNDDGPAEVFAVGLNGEKRGKVRIADASNKDWEGIASFELDGRPYLLVGDIGDNKARRKKRTLYVIEEPDPDEKKVDPAWQINYRYPDGPRDVESVAVDVERQRVLLLSKRDIPPVLYELPLRPATGETITATRLGEVYSLQRPSVKDVQNAQFTKDWHWQPTDMDISPDNRSALILTYSGVYYYRRDAAESWFEALMNPPLRLGLGRLHNAESLSISADGGWALLTTEGKHAPVVHIDLGSVVAAQVTLMTFNVENLFDNDDDPGKDDKAYLPIELKQSDAHRAACAEIEVERWRDECLHLDWSDDTIDYKLGVLAAAIRQVGGGRGPDVVALQEVENVAILEQLRQRLDGLDYLEPVLVEGDDVRGIDVAFLTRLPLIGEPELHRASFDEFPQRAGDTRGVLEATFELPDGSPLTGYAVHFPAPFHPTGMREIAYRHLAGLRDALPDDHYVFAAGDFNTTSSEDAERQMLDRLVRPHWQVGHEFGCAGCLGTHYYARGDSWSYLDMVLFSPARGADTTWKIRADSAWIGNRTEAQVSLSGTPERFAGNDRRGVSDHWPLVITIESN